MKDYPLLWPLLEIVLAIGLVLLIVWSTRPGKEKRRDRQPGDD